MYGLIIKANLDNLVRLLALLSVDEHDAALLGDEAEGAEVLERGLRDDGHLPEDCPQVEDGEQVEAELVVGHDHHALPVQGLELLQTDDVPMLPERKTKYFKSFKC